MRTSDFDFTLPTAQIALRPVRPRDAARMLVVSHSGGDEEREKREEREESIEDSMVRALPKLLRAGDCLVFNNSRVLPVQLYGRRGQAAIAATLLKPLGERRWSAFLRNAKRVRLGDQIDFFKCGEQGTEPATEHRVTAHVRERCGDGSFVLEFSGAEAMETLLERVGHMPLPPYIASKRAPDRADHSDYQTMFADRAGAVAAPTAALHFTPRLMNALAEAGIAHAMVTLHVGAGTFLPVKVENPTAHTMHSEWGQIDSATAAQLNAVRRAGGRIIAVGTTSLRLLESAADASGKIRAFAGDTDIYITPGYCFRAIDGLITNFHLPRSTLFMLVAALMGLQTMHRAYRHAIVRGYRFYSYGDSSLLLPRG